MNVAIVDPYVSIDYLVKELKKFNTPKEVFLTRKLHLHLEWVKDKEEA